MDSIFSNTYTINRAKQLGFDLCGMVRCRPSGDAERVERWLSEGNNGSMEWFDRNKKQRYNPHELTEPNVEKSLIVCGVSYQLHEHKYSNLASSYAHFSDYHITIKKMLNALLGDLESKVGRSLNGRVYVDSAPLLERYWAKEAGFGWIGKNSMLVNRELGSMFFIGSLLVEGEFDFYNKPLEEDGCGDCRRCVDVCKNRAINTNRTINCNRCLSYITIEHKMPFSEEHKEIIKRGSDKVFGCDDCLKVCPWNIASSKKIEPSIGLKREEKLSFMAMPNQIDELKTYRLPKLSPLKRAGRKKIDAIIKILEERE
ncbi:MAG: tRNA epoxyqueuosine(34) reductase QueG [Rikenellaceae bacterium]